MKFLSLVLLATFSAAPAFADTQVGNQPDPNQQILPIRQAKAHIVINKLTFTAAPNPTTTVTQVCDQTIQAPVFDTRNRVGPWWYQGGQLECPAMLGQSKVNVQVNASINFSNRTSPSDQTDRKYFQSGLWISPVPGSTMPAGNYNAQGVSAWSHDLTVRSMGLDLSPSVLWMCLRPGPHEELPFPENNKKMKLMTANDPDQNCKPMLDEWFTASVEFED